ncbi:MAG: PAS domain-containing protein, partial [Gammaproteobacteria bacterium]|nr:PAS domain-containing protein [Gammaproteobacteria bacterium]
MIGEADSIGELHWLLGIIQNVDVGLVVIDRDCNVRLWNGFMENHSGQHPSAVNGKPIFEM